MSHDMAVLDSVASMQFQFPIAKYAAVYKKAHSSSHAYQYIPINMKITSIVHSIVSPLEALHHHSLSMVINVCSLLWISMHP